MAAASNSPAAPSQSQSQNSPRDRHLRRASATIGVPSLPENSSSSPSLAGMVDQEKFAASSFSTPSDSLASQKDGIPVAATSSLTEDGSSFPAGADPRPENSENVGATKKPAWNKPSSDGTTIDFGAVMGADSWPALSESTRASPKISSTDSPKAIFHGSVAPLQKEVVNASISTTSSASNHVVPNRQRSMKRIGGGSSHSSITSNGSPSQAPHIQSFVAEAAPSNPGKYGASAGESPRDNMNRDTGPKGGSSSGNELYQQRGSFKRSNSGLQSRGDGSYHHSHGGRRDQERGKQDWSNAHRNYGTRDNLSPRQRVSSRPFIRSPVSNAPFISVPPPPIAVHPFVSPIVYPEMSSPVFYMTGPHPESLRPISMVPIPQMFYTMTDPLLPSKIVSQIDYYFSSENLVRDTYLRQNMNGDGWVPISLIATFKKIAMLTDNIQLILDAVQTSNVVEVQGDKVRCKNDWNKWIIPPVLYSPGTSPQALHIPSQDMISAQINNVTLDEKAAR
ncbi:la-related protein 1C-like [Primulina tabacum]|uniref:la-related protein 1C-like n=1 Tax=Primulina tabacum TaxID=48773 RepID=UPI003F599DEA